MKASQHGVQLLVYAVVLGLLYVAVQGQELPGRAAWATELAGAPRPYIQPAKICPAAGYVIDGVSVNADGRRSPRGRVGHCLVQIWAAAV